MAQIRIKKSYIFINYEYETICAFQGFNYWYLLKRTCCVVFSLLLMKNFAFEKEFSFWTLARWKRKIL